MNLKYEGTVYRPPSEAGSLIVQATIGCSHNKCTFCSMYKDKKFRIRNTGEILEDIDLGRKTYKKIERIFLADGDALMIKTDELLKILNHIKITIPECKRIGIYTSPKSIQTKTPEELKDLNRAGLKIAYLGLESGCDNILMDIKKGMDSKGIILEARKLKDAGFQLSLTLISGLGGKSNWKSHALKSASVINKIKPDYLGLLTLMIEPNTVLFDQVSNGSFQVLNPQEIALETLELLKNLDCDQCIFRSNHASNYLPLRGTLNQDRERMIHEIEEALKGNIDFKAEWMRGL